MLIVGHTALAYLFTRPLLALDKSISKPVNIFLIFIFVNIVDFINFSVFRYFIHTMIGIYLFSIFWVLFFYKFKIVEKNIILLLLLAISMQIVGDYLFGEIYFFAPIINTRYSAYGYNHLIGHFAESILFVIFFTVFIITKDYQKMKVFIHNEKNKFFKILKLKKFFNPELYIFYLFIAFYLFSIVQFIFFVSTHINFIKEFILVIGTFLFFFILFLVLFTYIGFGSFPKNNRQKIEKC